MRLSVKTLWFLLFAFLVGCTRPEPIPEPEFRDKEITFPKLINFPQTDLQIDTTEQLESRVYPSYISGLDVFTYDSVVGRVPALFGDIRDSFDIATTQDYVVFVDVNQSFKEKFFEPIHIKTWTEDKNGKLIPPKQYIAPYDSIAKLPVFVVNISDSNQIIENHDRRLVMIQEAKDKNGKWKPIEYFQFSGCGNSYGEYLIPKGEKLMFGVNKYKGDFKTSLRVRLVANGTVLFSNEYMGEINLGQFEFNEENHGWNYNKYLDQYQFDELE